MSAPDRFAGAVVVRRSDLLWRCAPGFLVVSTVDGEALRAEGPAPAIWERLRRPIAFDDLCDELAHEHGVEAEQVRADVSPFLERLIDAGFVELAEPEIGSRGADRE